jgi:hypothetical protein
MATLPAGLLRRSKSSRVARAPLLIASILLFAISVSSALFLIVDLSLPFGVLPKIE